jgi:hypothetical protein
MKQRMILLATLLVVFLSASAKKLKVTIDGTASPSQQTLYLIVNEDTAKAQLISVNEGKFTVTVKVNEDDFIRLSENKERPTPSSVVIMADERNISVDMESRTVKGSYMTDKLRAAIKRIENAGPGHFHIDVFTDDPKAWEEAKTQERMMREEMKEQQRLCARQVLEDERYNDIPAWIVIVFPEQVSPWLDKYIEEESMWLEHPVRKKKD